MHRKGSFINPRYVVSVGEEDGKTYVLLSGYSSPVEVKPTLMQVRSLIESTL